MTRTFDVDIFDSFFVAKPFDFYSKNYVPRNLGIDGEVLLSKDEFNGLQSKEFKLLWFHESYEYSYMDGFSDLTVRKLDGPYRDSGKNDENSCSHLISIGKFPIELHEIEYFSVGNDRRSHSDGIDDDRLRKTREEIIKKLYDNFESKEVRTRALYRGISDNGLVEVACHDKILPTLKVQGFGSPGIRDDIFSLLGLYDFKESISKHKYNPSISDYLSQGYGYNIPELSLVTDITDLKKLDNILL